MGHFLTFCLSLLNGLFAGQNLIFIAVDLLWDLIAGNPLPAQIKYPDFFAIQVRHRRTCREARAPKELSSARLCDPLEAGLSAGDVTRC